MNNVATSKCNKDVSTLFLNESKGSLNLLKVITSPKNCPILTELLGAMELFLNISMCLLSGRLSSLL